MFLTRPIGLLCVIPLCLHSISILREHEKGFLNNKKARAALEPTSSAPGRAEQTKVPDEGFAGSDKNAGSLDDVQITVTDVLKRPALITIIPGPGSVKDTQSCQVVTVASTKSKVLSNPALRRAMLNAPPTKCAVEGTTDMGLGLFATTDISFGERILVERPFVVLPKNIGHAFKIPQTGRTPNEWHEVCMDEAERLLKLAVERMDKDDADQLRSRCNISTEDPQKRPLVSILVACAMNLGFDDAPDALGFGNGYLGIPRLGSRINHSCAPNAVFDFDSDSFSVLYTATRDIKAGEQVFLGYVPSAIPVAQRRQAMARYKFICKCPACTNATPATDRLRTGFQFELNNLAQSLSRVTGNTPATRSLLKRTLIMKDVLEKEGLDAEPRFSEVWVALQVLYQRTGNVAESEKCRRKLETYTTFPGYIKAVKQVGMRV